MFKRRSNLPEEFHATNRRLKQEMLEQGIRRPNRRIMVAIAASGLAAGAIGIGLSLQNREGASTLFFMLTIVLAVVLLVVQQSPRFGQFVKKEMKEKRASATSPASDTPRSDDAS